MLITCQLVEAFAIKPSIPIFTLEYVVTPFNVPEVSRINPYTGENESLSPSFSGERQYIEITVENQQFTTYTNLNGNPVNLFYNVSFKGHHSIVWGHYPDSAYEDLFNASMSDYTSILVPIDSSIPDKGKLDFRLEALIGHYNYETTASGVEYVNGFTAFERSGWSDVQTITISQSPSSGNSETLPPLASPTETRNSTPSGTSTQTGNQPAIDLTSLAIAALLGGFVTVTVIFLYTRKAKT
jgi:hypothetical protein